MTHVFKNFKFFNVLHVPVRYKNPSHHWSVTRRKTPVTQKALDHFDDFYPKVYGDESWKNIKSAMLAKNHKYVAVINNFSDTERIREELENIGAMDIKMIYEAAKRTYKMQQLNSKTQEIQDKLKDVYRTLDQVMVKHQQDKTIYPDPSDDHTMENQENNDKNNTFKPVKLQSIEVNVNKIKSDNRFISPSSVTSSLHEYIPATKIKGMDDFILESEHYSYYKQGADYKIIVEKENELRFPDKLLLYTFEEGNDTRFPKPKNGSTELLDYFVLDGASIFPILSLDLQARDKFLDMCAAPGGKTMMALQSLNLQLIVANDIQESRINRINEFVHEFLLDSYCDKSFYITHTDARYIEDNGIYNKILVDVPCTTDRHVLHEHENNIFKGTRVQERLRLPQLQSEILSNALKLVVPGGTVVYSTCTLSPVQNDGVVQMSLKKAFEEHNVVFKVIDQTEALSPLRHLYNFADVDLKYGHIVVPSKSRNSGPMYFCKMIRIQ